MPRETITSEAELRAIVGEPSRAIAEMGTDRIDEQSARFLRASPLFLLATTSADGDCDVSPRGDPPGSVLILDEHTLAFGERKGNRRLDSLRNILAQPKVGMLFVVPGMNETIRVNGTATILRDAPYLDRLVVRGHRPDLAVEIRVEELYMHCAKAFIRSALWRPASWPERAALPTAGQLVRGQERLDLPAEVIDHNLAEDIRTELY